MIKSRRNGEEVSVWVRLFLADGENTPHRIIEEVSIF